MTEALVATAAGRLRGTTDSAPNGQPIHRFLGIPYAAPPVGDLRWRAPQPAQPWAGIRDATAFGDAAPQAEPLESRLPGFEVERASEDCLSLNVWTPALDGSRPVMVWIHGGAFSSGGSAQPVYDGARLATEGDVVLVTINYRLGALGFLAPEGDADANCGLRDQLAALSWVREHASVVGGDPRRLTVFGESAGGGSIQHLLASRRRGDAFDQAIVQSGQPRTLTADEAALVADALARSLELATSDASSLRAVNVDRLLAAQVEATAATVGAIGVMPFHPAIDGDVCDLAILDAVKRGSADGVPIVIGTTRDELSLFPEPRAAALDDEALGRWVQRLVGDGVDARDVIETYREQLGGAPSNAVIWDGVRTDALMRIPNLSVAEAHAGRGTPTYVFRFDWDAPGLGAAHAVDVPFTFGTFDREGWGDVVGYDADADRLSAILRHAWTSFAATGSPDAGVDWRSYDSVRRPTLLLGRTGAVMMNDPAGATRRSFGASGQPNAATPTA